MDFDWNDKTIIIAEDDQLNFILLQKMLESTCIEILWAKNGKDIINYIESREDVDLILTDLHMPEMDGRETVEYLRNKNLQVPIILQSATSDSEIDSFMQSGCNDFVRKPINKTELLEKMESLIN